MLLVLYGKYDLRYFLKLQFNMLTHFIYNFFRLKEFQKKNSKGK